MGQDVEAVRLGIDRQKLGINTVVVLYGIQAAGEPWVKD
jgi:hypothetical protein